ncbi:MAG: aminotransferase class V-fold PLP-dependent enzyme [Planctomycetota bacterium]
MSCDASKCCYLDHAAASSPKPQVVADAVSGWLLKEAGSAGRGAHEAARRAGALLTSVRQRLADLVNAEGPERMLLTTCSTDSLALAILGTLSPPCRPTDVRRKPRVVTTLLEHNAVARPLTALEESGTIELVRVPFGEHGFVDPQAVLAEVNENTDLVAMNWVSNVLGTIQDVGAVGRGLRAKGSEAIFLVDGSQAAGYLDIDVQADCIDLLAFNGQKALRGPSGTGSLYIGPRAYRGDRDPALERLQPVRYGGTGGGGCHLPDELPDRFEVGTQNDAGFAGLDAALALGKAPSTSPLLGVCAKRVAEIDGVDVLSSPDAAEFGKYLTGGRIGIMTLNIAGVDPLKAEARCDEISKIAVRGGLHCAPWLHNQLGTDEQGGGLRVSVGWTSTEADIDRFVGAIHTIASEA